jgi:hypothetical protein
MWNTLSPERSGVKPAGGRISNPELNRQDAKDAKEDPKSQPPTNTDRHRPKSGTGDFTTKAPRHQEAGTRNRRATTVECRIQNAESGMQNSRRVLCSLFAARWSFGPRPGGSESEQGTAGKAFRPTGSSGLDRYGPSHGQVSGARFLPRVVAMALPSLSPAGRSGAKAPAAGVGATSGGAKCCPD